MAENTTHKLIGQNYTTPDIVAKVTGKAKYSEDYRVDGKWPDYRDYCDGLLFAVAPEFPMEVLPEDVGLIVADAYGGEMLREAPRHPLSPARRKSLTIAFAKLAAGRLALLEDPQP